MVKNKKTKWILMALFVIILLNTKSMTNLASKSNKSLAGDSVNTQYNEDKHEN